jgi:hypothetical protein
MSRSLIQEHVFMTKFALLAASSLILCMSASAGGVRNVADACIAHVTKGQVRVYRDVEVLASGRDRIAYFRCIRSGLRGDTPFSAFSGLTPHVATGFGGGGTGFSGVTLNL